MFATFAWRMRKFKTRPVGLLVLTETAIVFEPATMQEFRVSVSLGDLSSARAAMVGTYLRLQGGQERHDFFFVPGTAYEEALPASWRDTSGVNAEAVADDFGVFADAIAPARIIPDLPYGDLLKVPGAISATRRGRKLVDAWLAAIRLVQERS